MPFGSIGSSGSGAVPSQGWQFLIRIVGDGTSDTLESGVLTSFDNFLIIFKKRSAINENHRIQFNKSGGVAYDQTVMENVTVGSNTGLASSPLLTTAGAADVDLKIHVFNQPATEPKTIATIGAKSNSLMVTGMCRWNQAVDLITQIDIITNAGGLYTSADSMAIFGMNNS